MQLGEDWFQADERIYAIRAGEFSPETRGFTNIERSDVLGLKWWSAAEIVATQELVFPERSTGFGEAPGLFSIAPLPKAPHALVSFQR